MLPVRLVLPPPGTLTPIGASDPLRFYYKPLVGRLFQARLNTGLQLLDRRFRRLLEIGYGSGLLIPTLASISDEFHGVDIEREPTGLRGALETLGVRAAELFTADVQELPYPDAHFDGAVAFSILEHLRRGPLRNAAAEIARVLEPGGLFLVGCPAVHRAMNLAFALIGFGAIRDHHFSGIGDVLEACAPHFEEVRRATLPCLFDRAVPLGWAPYTTVLLRRR
jgi:SAM-dependent methyltransferase